MYYVYVLQNSQGILYKGQTSDLIKRIQQHNDPNSSLSYTRNRGPWTLVYKEELLTRSEAIQKEKFLKTGKGRDFLKAIVDQ
ncbi:GIY-YIG nuclease family protein [Patescibacteria group bacterium]|nr:GIY-YIG nuclease family protein [Patescibacteria group bacterium]MBU1123708.1 GIY-YIG nuclease family protein [Patescibacteria group bacterium]MBU1911863.1 GIY-YIG nuclease family protein [Patescibacteria group bacterium]